MNAEKIQEVFDEARKRWPMTLEGIYSSTCVRYAFIDGAQWWALKDNWQLVTDTAPAEGEAVLVWDPVDGPQTFPNVYPAWKTYGYWTVVSSGRSCNPTHWQPLPKPPKGQKDATETE